MEKNKDITRPMDEITPEEGKISKDQIKYLDRYEEDKFHTYGVIPWVKKLPRIIAVMLIALFLVGIEDWGTYSGIDTSYNAVIKDFVVFVMIGAIVFFLTHRGSEWGNW